MHHKHPLHHGLVDWYLQRMELFYPPWVAGTDLTQSRRLRFVGLKYQKSISFKVPRYGPLTRYVQFRVVHAPGMPRTFSRYWFLRKPLVSDPGMHHATCVTHVPWYMSEWLTRGAGKTFPAFPAHAQTEILRIWQEEAHDIMTMPWRVFVVQKWNMNLTGLYV